MTYKDFHLCQCCLNSVDGFGFFFTLVGVCSQTFSIEQRQRMERSRQLALERRTARLSMQ